MFFFLFLVITRPVHVVHVWFLTATVNVRNILSLSLSLFFSPTQTETRIQKLEKANNEACFVSAVVFALSLSLLVSDSLSLVLMRSINLHRTWDSISHLSHPWHPAKRDCHCILSRSVVASLVQATFISLSLQLIFLAFFTFVFHSCYFFLVPSYSLSRLTFFCSRLKEKQPSSYICARAGHRFVVIVFSSSFLSFLSPVVSPSRMLSVCRHCTTPSYSSAAAARLARRQSYTPHTPSNLILSLH